MTIKKTDLSGILGFPVAPFNSDGSLNEKAFSENVEFLVKAEVSAVFIAGGAGEYQSLTEREYEQMLEVALSITNQKVPLYTGVGGNISTSIELAQLSERKGADGYLILPPYLIHGEQEGLYHYYKSIIESTSLNAVIYQRDNAVLKLKTLEQLISNHPQLVGFKDGIGNMEFNIEAIHSIGNRVQWINGMPFAEITMPAYFHLGYQVYSSAISNYIPHISKFFYEALKENNQELIHDLYIDVLLPINQIRKEKKGYAVSLIKAGMEIIGLPVGELVRPPLVAVEKEHYRELEKVIAKAHSLYPEK
ncbi:5-dehydro-4-deoxyglucarate dehydratase [Halalkalibacter oceani]|uniref:5-dehydro-4-deoxyglucarate dehydratase n=1 Tax=Halalkalibacter oceani TaxID=1653776 RepID=UPI003398D7CD